MRAGNSRDLKLKRAPERYWSIVYKLFTQLWKLFCFLLFINKHKDIPRWSKKLKKSEFIGAKLKINLEGKLDLCTKVQLKPNHLPDFVNVMLFSVVVYRWYCCPCNVNWQTDTAFNKSNESLELFIILQDKQPFGASLLRCVKYEAPDSCAQFSNN